MNNIDAQSMETSIRITLTNQIQIRQFNLKMSLGMQNTTAHVSGNSGIKLDYHVCSEVTLVDI